MDEEIITTQECEQFKLDTALQLLAVFIHRFGGDVVINQNEFDMLEGVPISAQLIAPSHLRLRLMDEFEDEGITYGFEG